MWEVGGSIVWPPRRRQLHDLPGGYDFSRSISAMMRRSSAEFQRVRMRLVAKLPTSADVTLMR